MVRAGEVGGFLDAVLTADRGELRGRGQAARQDQVGDDLPGRRLRHRDPRGDRHAALHRPGLREDVQRPRRRAAGCRPQILVILSHAHEVRSRRRSSSRIVVGPIVWSRIKHQDRVRSVVDPLKLKLPVFGTLFQKIALSRFTRNLGTMMQLGRADPAGPGHRRRHQPATSCCERAVTDVQESVRSGESLAGPAGASTRSSRRWSCR